MTEKVKKQINDDAHAYAIRISAAPSDWTRIEDNYRAGVLAVWGNPGKYGLEHRRPKTVPLATIEELEEAFLHLRKDELGEKKCKAKAQDFLDHYNANGWMVGKTKMKNWKSAVSLWTRRENNENTHTTKNNKDVGTSASRKPVTGRDTSKPREFGEKW